MTGAFDTVVVVDWSASATPSPARPSANAIWIGIARPTGETTCYLRTRAAAAAWLGALLDSETTAGRRVLCGFDFPFGYPDGLARRVTGMAGAPAIWSWLAQNISDGSDNRNNRFQLAARVNAMFGGRGPFWGRPRSLVLPDLPETKAVDYAVLGLSERRRVETAVPRAQPVWKLYTTGSVGGQALTGLPLVAALVRRPGITVWPFEPPRGRIVLAEVYPSLINPAVARAGAGIKDEHQVRLLARALLRLSQSGRLGGIFDSAPDWPGRNDEGWILGAGAAHVMLGALA